VNGLEEDLTIEDRVSMQFDPSCLIRDAEIDFVGMQVDSAIYFMLFGVESHFIIRKIRRCMDNLWDY